MSVVLWLFEFGYLLQHFATIIQIMKIQKKRSTELVSIETNFLFLIGAFSRIVWMWDSMLKGFFLAYFEIAIGFGSLFYILFLFHKFKGSDYYSVDYKLPPYLKLYSLLPAVLILSFFFHPGTKNNYYYTNQMFVSVGIFSEALGLLPQLYYIRRVNDTGNVSQYYGVCLAIARFFRLLFWIRMYFDGNKFMSLIVADLIHCIFLFDFTYKVLSNWNKPIIPTFGNTEETPSSKKIF